MVVALSFVVIVSPLLYTLLFTSSLSIRAKAIVGTLTFLVLAGLPILALVFKANFGL